MALSQEAYRKRAYDRAFGDYGADWLPAKGYRANRARIVKLYDYYRDLFNQNIDTFLWAGLARMAGGAVVGGLDDSAPVLGDPTDITTTMVKIGKAIFDDLAWLHEAYMDDPAAAIALAALYDLEKRRTRSYAEALTRMATGIPSEVVAGNAALLEIEQRSIIQPLYDTLRHHPNSTQSSWLGRALEDATSGGVAAAFARTRAFVSNVHPYHLDFILSFSNGLLKDVTVFADRWEWINLPGGMWDKWANGYRGPTVGVSNGERVRLANIPFDHLLRHEYGQVDERLLPTGANY